jgi:hypothetical protein
MEKRMQIASVSTMPQVMQASKAPEATEGRGPDHDGDSDDRGVAGPTASATAPGVGNSVDISA